MTPVEPLGKRFAAVFPHSDDLAIFAGGTVLKLLADGYAGYFIRTTNDDKDSYSLSAAETAFRVEAETLAVTRFLGLTDVFTLDYQNHYLQASVLVELRHRLILLFRFLRIDTVITFDPCASYEENPDHSITAKAVEAASWMSGRNLDLPELGKIGIAPQRVRRRYYVARGPQAVNHVVDISSVRDRKREAVLIHRTPLDHMWQLHRDDDPESSLSLEQFADAYILAGDAAHPTDREAFHVVDDVAGPWTGREVR